MKKIIPILMLAIPMIAFSQNYEERKIITTSGDTLSGKIEILVKGESSLLRFKDSFYLEKNNMIHKLEIVMKEATIKNKNDESKTYSLPQKNYLKILDTELGDCYELKQEIIRTQLNENSLVRLLVKYNACDKNKRPSTDIDNRSRFSIGLIGGYSTIMIDKFTDVYKTSVDLKEFKTSNQARYGININFIGPKRIFVTLGLQSLAAEHESILTTTTTIQKIRVGYNLFNIPVHMGFRFFNNTRNHSPIISVGMSYNLVKEGENSRQVTFLSTGETSSINPIFKFKSSAVFASAQAGYMYTVTPKICLFALYQYQRGRSFLDEKDTQNNNGPVVQSHSWMFSVNYVLGSSK